MYFCFPFHVATKCVTLHTSCFLHTLASANIRNYSEIQTLLPRRLPEGTQTLWPARQIFLFCCIVIQFEHMNSFFLQWPAVAAMHNRCRSNAWWETFTTTAGEWGLLPVRNEKWPLNLIPRKSVPTLSRRSYLSCSLADWKRDLFTLFHTRHAGHTHLSALSTNPQSPKHEYSPDTPVDGEAHPFTFSFEGKPDFGTCCFPLLELCVNGHIFTHSFC